MKKRAWKQLKEKGEKCGVEPRNKMLVGFTTWQSLKKKMDGWKKKQKTKQRKMKEWKILKEVKNKEYKWEKQEEQVQNEWRTMNG